MHTFTIRSLALARAVAGGIGVAVGKDTVPPARAEELKKQDTVPPATGKSVPEQAGTQEPSSRVPSAKDADVLTNGVLTVPGAPADVDTAPAKFSARTAADDQTPIVGYRLRHLTNDQRREIVQALSPQRDAFRPAGANDGYAIIGAEIPAGVALQALAPVPDALAARFPALKGAAFMRSEGKVLVVDPGNNLVIGVLGG